MAQERKFWLKHPSTHKFPDFLLPTRRLSPLMPLKWDPNTAEARPLQMTGIWDFVQQHHNFIAAR
jgi:hypothetical protein